MSEYAHQLRKLTDPPGPRKIAGMLAVGLAGLAAGFVIINLFVTRPLWEPDMGLLSDQLQALQENSGQVDTLFIGSSRVNASVNVLGFDAANTAAGQPTSSLSMWIANNSHADTQYLLDELEKLDLTNLRYVVIEPRLQILPAVGLVLEGQNAYSVRVRKAFNFERSVESARLAAFGGESPRVRAAQLASVFYLAGIHLTNVGVLQNIVISDSQGDASRVEKVWQNRGMVRDPNDKIRPGRGLAQPNTDDGFRSLTETELSALREVVDRLLALDVEIVFYFPPTRIFVGIQRSIKNALNVAYPDIKIMSYIYGDTDPALFDDNDAWKDNNHMMYYAAEEFTKTFSEDWQALMSGPEPAR